MEPYTVYLTSRNYSTFTHSLSKTLHNMKQYEVKLSGCIISPTMDQSIVVQCNCISPQLYNNEMASVLGIANAQTGLICSEYVSLCYDEISFIRCRVSDVDLNPISLNHDVLLMLHFRPTHLSSMC